MSSVPDDSDDKPFFIPEPYPTILEPLAIGLPKLRPGYRVCDCGRWSDNNALHAITIGGIAHGEVWRSKMSWCDDELDMGRYRDDILRLRWKKMIQDADEWVEQGCKPIQEA